MAESTGETRDQRLTRNVGELLQEMRVAQAGVQILFGFLLSVVFTAQFRAADGFEKGLHLAAVLLALASTVLLTAPAAWHRVLFHTGARDRIVHAGNRTVLAGLACLALSLTVTVALIADVVYGRVAMGVAGGAALLGFVLLWLVVPWRLRSRGHIGERKPGDDHRGEALH